MKDIKILPMEEIHCEGVEMVAKKSLPERFTKEMARDVLNYPHNLFFVAIDEKSNEVIGFVGIMVIIDEVELLYIAVDELYRNASIGQHLLDLAIEKAKEKQGKRILLEVRKQNEKAKRFYIRNKFTVLSERKGYYTNPDDDAVIMELLF